MKYHLSGAALDVEGQLIARSADFSLSGDVPGPENHICNDVPILISEVVDAADMFPRYDEQMDRGVRVGIFEDDERCVFINKFRGTLSPDDLTKKAISTQLLNPSRRVPVSIQK